MSTYTQIYRVVELMAHKFPEDFKDYIAENPHVYEAFEREALRVIARGYRHYSARTIMEVLRHESALTENASVWKINNNQVPYLARLFALCQPAHASLFDFREAKAAKRSHSLAGAFATA